MTNSGVRSMTSFGTDLAIYYHVPTELHYIDYTKNSDGGHNSKDTRLGFLKI